YYFPQKTFSKTNSLKWKGGLTPYQNEVSEELLKGISSKENLLVHAVTGAGKTEMIYHSIAKVIDTGGSVCIASPRIDVCLELHKRLSNDFRCAITLMHGESPSYQRSPLTIATTHQLLKFYHAFDLLIVDEVDAFPYVDNPILYHGVKQALKENGTSIFLTATSTTELERKVARKELKKLHLARRFHANPLVIPEMVWVSGIQKSLQTQKLPPKLYQLINKQRQTRYPLLLFFPHISEGQVFTEMLRQAFPMEKIGFVSSKSTSRLKLVQDFRDNKLSILVSTTILERGVTFPSVDVFVIQANHHLFTKSSLVQISGRVGRALERPEGLLYFLHDGKSKSMHQAIKEIKNMNHIGGF
ncbi:DEAD/DEAH box helicase, partial [Streptococcus agalactiae]|nr:DEAD/DEAH box helicase [Streptococcus agalactiae]MCC9933604.1 DEAD/DEAH box helicase [Streptococcus agalactiae]